MMAQYHALKAAHPGMLLFFRMGDFYELFFDDAEKAAPALDIALTRRGRHEGQDIPMCGVPVHSAESYLERLIRKGFRVAICEQLEDPAEAKKRGGKTLVKRDVVRIVTPGTLTEESLLETRRHNYLAAIGRSQGRHAVAWVDISTGALMVEGCDVQELGPLLARIDPGELLLPEQLDPASPGLDATLAETLAEWRPRIGLGDDSGFESLKGERLVREVFAVQAVDAFGDFDRAELAALGGLLAYLRTTQKGLIPRLDRPKRSAPGSTLRIDPATRRNLELLETLDGNREGSLLQAIDRTVTALGGRLLAERLAAPLAQADAIRTRLAEVASLVDAAARRADLRQALRGFPDMPRALSRLALGRGGPRDLQAVGRGLATAGEVAGTLSEGDDICQGFAQGLADHAELARKLLATLEEQAPVQARDGGFIRRGADAALDAARELRDEGRKHIAALEARYRDATGIPSLKVRHNHMLGYYIEVTAAHRAKVPEGFIQRQSMANATRYSTAELADLESRLAEAAEEAERLELALFETLRAAVLAEAEGIAGVAERVAMIDVTAALAELAETADLVRPEITDGLDFEVRKGRHPVVEQALAKDHGRFVANDCRLEDAERLWLVTGPNMAGKSTFLRQNALIVVMAQMGSFVPAEAAAIGVVDRLFSRVGAADDIARGRSTFMVEMVETAAILNQSTERSLVILDEIGRGTATFDGLSLAWAVIEYLHDVNRCRGLFATHFHELTALASKLEALSAHTVRIKEWQGEVVFLHEVVPGTADRSYGIHVARLSGLPKPVLERAETVLKRLEDGEARSAPAQLADDLPLFRAALEQRPAQPAAEPPKSEALALLRSVNPDEVTPRDALDLLYRLRRKLDEDETPT